MGWQGGRLDLQVGEEGDANRRQNSDPVLWRLLGPVAGRRVLDAGCGTGYLSRKLARAGARVIGVDVAPRMVAIAQAKAREQQLDIEHRVDSISELAGTADQSVDALVSNYVLMDAPDLEGAARSIARVLVLGGVAVVIFSHPCFPQAHATRVDSKRGRVRYDWPFSYFEPQKRVDPPWRHFSGFLHVVAPPALALHPRISRRWLAARRPRRAPWRWGATSLLDRVSVVASCVMRPIALEPLDSAAQGT